MVMMVGCAAGRCFLLLLSEASFRRRILPLTSFISLFISLSMRVSRSSLSPTWPSRGENTSSLGGIAHAGTRSTYALPDRAPSARPLTNQSGWS